MKDGDFCAGAFFFWTLYNFYNSCQDRKFYQITKMAEELSKVEKTNISCEIAGT